MFIIGFTMMIIIAVKEDEIPLVLHKSLGWVCTYIFAIGLIRNLQIFYRKSSPLKPKKFVNMIQMTTDAKLTGESFRLQT